MTGARTQGDKTLEGGRDGAGEERALLGEGIDGAILFEGLRGTRWTFTASGLVTNLAARLAAAAADGQIVAGPETVRRLGDRYRLERLGRERLKNIGEAIDLYRILGAS